MKNRLLDEHKRYLRYGMSISEIAKRRGVTRQATSKYLKVNGLLPVKSSKTILEISERIEFHLESAKNLRTLAEYLIQKTEVVCMESASRSLKQLIKEMENGKHC